MTEEREVTVRLTKKEAERLSFGLADTACWLSGYLSALEDKCHAPLGLDEIRDLNVALKGAIERAERRTEPKEIF